ncbi:hypothetical protein D3C72_638210 [compost metagenome]
MAIQQKHQSLLRCSTNHVIGSRTLKHQPSSTATKPFSRRDCFVMRINYAATKRTSLFWLYKPPASPSRPHASSSSALCCGGAISSILRTRCLSVRPRKSATPNSVTISPASLRGMVTGPLSRATIRLLLRALEGRAIIGRPPFDSAPRA